MNDEQRVDGIVAAVVSAAKTRKPGLRVGALLQAEIADAMKGRQTKDGK